MNANALSLLGVPCGVGGDVIAQDSSLLLHPSPSLLPIWPPCTGKGCQWGGESVFKFFSQSHPGIQFNKCSRARYVKGRGPGAVGLEV